MTPTLDQIRRAVADYYQISEGALLSPSRLAEYARPRMLGYKISRDVTGAEYQAIGAAYSGRDHSTIISGIRSIENHAAHQAKLGSNDIAMAIKAVTARAEWLAIVERKKPREIGQFSTTRNKEAA